MTNKYVNMKKMSFFLLGLALVIALPLFLGGCRKKRHKQPRGRTDHATALTIPSGGEELLSPSYRLYPSAVGGMVREGTTLTSTSYVLEVGPVAVVRPQ